MDLLENIRIFRRVAELSSFSGAAKDLRMAQPSVSRAVASLEETLGVTLLRRSTRSLRLTNEGQKLLTSSEDVLPRVEEMLSSVRGEKRALEGQLRIAASFSIGRLVLNPLVERFCARHPGVVFHFRMSDAYVDLIKENIDVAIRQGNLHDSSLRALRIGTTRVLLYGSRRYLETHGAPQSVEALQSHRLIFFTRRSSEPTWTFADETGRPLRIEFRPYFECDSIDMVREAVIAGLGISLLPSWMMIGPEGDGRVERLLEAHTREELPMQAVTHARRDYSRKQRIFIEFLRREFDAVSSLALSR